MVEYIFRKCDVMVYIELKVVNMFENLLFILCLIDGVFVFVLDWYYLLCIFLVVRFIDVEGCGFCLFVFILIVLC